MLRSCGHKWSHVVREVFNSGGGDVVGDVDVYVHVDEQIAVR